MKRRVLSFFLLVFLLFTSVPYSAPVVFADDVTTPTVSAEPWFKEVYEAEDAALAGAVTAANLDDFSGLGYVDGLPNNASITFTVEADRAAEFGVRLRYTNGTGSTRTVGVYVNGTKIRDSQLARTINGTTWRIQLENLSLLEGTNTIMYRNDSANNCDDVRFDKINLSWMFEAENTAYVTRLGTIGLDVDNHPGKSGQDMAIQLQGQGLRFDVNAPIAGEYVAIVRYGCGFNYEGARLLSGYVNNTKIRQLRFACMRDWDNTWTDVVWNVNLNQGANTIGIQFDSGDDGLLNLDYITLKPVQWTYAGDITSIANNNTSELTVKLDNAEVKIKSVDANSVKVWLDPFGKYIRRYDSFTVVNEAVSPRNLNAEDKGAYYEIDAGAMFMRLQKSPFKITYLDKTGKILCENENESMGWTSDNEYKVKSVLQSDEQFWGLGEKLTPFNRRGYNVAMWSHDAYGALTNDSIPTEFEAGGRWYFSNPYFVSSKGYSILFDNPSRTMFDLGKTSGSTYSFGTYNPNPGNELIYYFIYGPELKQVSKTYSDIAGKTFFAPEWAYGNIQCHYGYRQTDIENISQTYRDKEIPLDMIMADIEWYDTQCTPTAWHRTMFPNPVSMFTKLKSLNVRMGVIDDPNVSATGNPLHPDYVTGNANGYFVKDHNDQTKRILWPWGQSYGNRGGGDSGLTDFFNPAARTWWGDQHNMILDQGVEAFWLDMNEPSKYNIDWLFYNEPGKAYGTISEVKNAYGIMHNRTMFDKLHEDGGRSLLLSRSGYLGSHRYVSPWTGDIQGSYQSLHEQINMGISMSMTGYNYWGFDIGGFFGGIENNLYKRWIELACFTPIHRFHYCDGVESKEPWTHQSEDVSRFYINLRYELKPYMYSLTADNILGIGIEKGYGAGGTGIPYVRPMVMEYPNDTNTYSMDTQFMAGPSFLVAPVVENSNTKNVYLPEGNWYDYFNAPLIYAGGRTMSYDAPPEVLPLFVKEGSIIPKYPLMQYWGEKPVDLLTLDIYPTVADGDFGFVHYEDDSETEDYLDGVYTTTAYDCNASYDGDKVAYKLDIEERKGTYTDIAPRDYMLQFHSGYLKNLSVELGGVKLSAKTSLTELNASSSGYCIESAIIYVKINDTGLDMTVNVSGEVTDGTSLEFEDGIIFGDAEINGALEGFSGNGYVTGLNSSADAVSIDFLQETAGLYPVYIRYRASEDTQLVVASGGDTVTVDLTGRIGSKWEETVVLLNLSRGGNNVRISGTGSSGGAAIDRLRIAENTYETPSFGNIVEAENAVRLGSNARVSSSTSGFSGTGYVDNLTATGNGVRFEGVKVKDAGRYAVKVGYRNSNATTRTLHIYANGNSAQSQTISLPRFRPANEQVAWYEVQVTLPLEAGENTVTVIRESGDSNGTGNDIFIDYLYYPLEELDLELHELTNGGFEQGNNNYAGWTINSTVSGSYGVDTGDAIIAARKLYTYNSGSTTIVTLYQDVTGIPNGDYLVEFWAKLYNAEPNLCEVRLSQYDGASALNYEIPHNGAWTHYSFPVEVKDGGIRVTFYHDMPPTSSLQLDDVTLWRIVSYKPYLKDLLGALIAECETLMRKDFTADSFNDLQAAMQMAKKWYDDPTSEPDRFASALELLETTRGELVPFIVDSTPVFTDVNDAVVSPLTMDVLNTSLAYTNMDSESVPLRMYVAVYTSEGRLQYVVESDEVVIESGETGSLSARLNMSANTGGGFASDGHYIRVFLWRGDTYAPVIPAYEE